MAKTGTSWESLRCGMSSGALTTSRVWSCTTLGEGMDQVMSEADRLELEERELEVQIQAQWQLDLRVLLFIVYIHVLMLNSFTKSSLYPRSFHCTCSIHESKNGRFFITRAIWCSKMYPSFISHDRCTGPSSSKLPRSKGS